MINLKVSTRLIVGFSFLVALLLTVTAIAFYGLSQLNNQLDAIARVNNTESRLANALRASILDRAIAMRNIALVTDAHDTASEEERIKRQEKVYADAYQQLSRMFADEPSTTERERALVAALKQDEAEALPPMRKAIALGVANDQAGATKELLQNVRPPQKTWIAHAQELANFEDQLSVDAQQEAVVAYSHVHTIIAVVVAISVLAAIAAGFLITRSVLRQLGGEPALAQYAAAQIAEGDLTVDLHVRPGDSSSLLASLETMRANLTSIVHGIKSSAESISVAAGEVAQGNVDLSQRTEEQAASLEETAASMEELTSTVRQNTDNARQGSTLAASASQTALNGGDVVKQVISTMEDISSSAHKVAEIISVIEGIAFQTNILALNAAVEAARAGEQGRGFAVVAGEVRTLAQRSAVAAKEIKELIETSVSHVTSGSQLVQDAGRTMGEVVVSVKRVTDIVSEIASASAEQSTGIEQVNVAVTQMDAVTQQNAALVEQATAAAQSMADQAEILKASVSIFRVEATMPGTSVLTGFRTEERAVGTRGSSSTKKAGAAKTGRVERVAI
jgi:methyl-accepting chemotaxis protein